MIQNRTSAEQPCVIQIHCHHEEVAMMTIKLVLFLLLTTLGLVWTERHASITHSLISKDSNQRQQAQTLSTAGANDCLRHPSRCLVFIKRPFLFLPVGAA